MLSALTETPKKHQSSPIGIPVDLKDLVSLPMNNDDEANKAIAEMNGHEMEGRPLRVNEARPKEEDS